LIGDAVAAAVAEAMAELELAVDAAGELEAPPVEQAASARAAPITMAGIRVRRVRCCITG